MSFKNKEELKNLNDIEKIIVENKRKNPETFELESEILQKAEDDLFDVCKKNISYDLFFDENILNKSWIYSFRSKDNNFKEEEYQNEKECYTTLLNNLKKVFFDDDIEIKEIFAMQSNYNDKEGYDIKFTTHDDTFSIEIPVVKNIVFESYKQKSIYRVDRFRIQVISQTKYTMIGKTFEETELKDILNDYLSNSKNMTPTEIYDKYIANK